MKKILKNQKAFTLTELIIVIAIIGILSVVMVPVLTGCIEDAKISNDTVLVANINKVLQANEVLDGRNNTAHDAINDAFEAGYGIEKLTPTTNGYYFIWDANYDEFVLMNSSLGEIYPKDKGTRPFENLFVLVGDHKKATELTNKGYSIYLRKEYDDPTKLLIKAGLDVGEETNISSISYENQGEGKNVIIRTNGGELIVNASLDTVHHYGKSNLVKVYAIDANNCFNENGNSNNICIAEGKLVVGKEAIVPNVSTFNYTLDGVTKGGEVTIENNGMIDSMDTVISKGSVNIENNGQINNCISGSKTNVTGSEIKNKIEVKSDPIEYTSGKISTEGYYYLSSNIVIESGSIEVTANAILNGNGYSISSSINGAVIVVSSNFTLLNTTINATNTEKTGRGIAIAKDDVELFLNGCVLNVTQRGISVNTGDFNAINITINSSIIQLTNGITDYDTEVNATSGFTHSRGISLWNMGSSTVNILNSTIQGFFYSINYAGDSMGKNIDNNCLTTINMYNSTFKGRCAINAHQDNAIWNVDSCNIHGINYFLGSTESFACIVINEGKALNNTVNLTNNIFTAYRGPVTDKNIQYAIDCRANYSVVNINEGNTMYETAIFTEKKDISETIDSYDSLTRCSSYSKINGSFVSATLEVKCLDKTIHIFDNWK